MVGPFALPDDDLSALCGNEQIDLDLPVPVASRIDQLIFKFCLHIVFAERFKDISRKCLPLHRITSYNVCYTKLLRETFDAAELEEDLIEEVPAAVVQPAVAGGKVEGVEALKALLKALESDDVARSLKGMNISVNIVITSYSIHYTKLYDAVCTSATRRVAGTRK